MQGHGCLSGADLAEHGHLHGGDQALHEGIDVLLRQPSVRWDSVVPAWGVETLTVGEEGGVGGLCWREGGKKGEGEGREAHTL